MYKQNQDNSNRNARLSSLIQQLLGQIIIPYLEGQSGLTTISQVEVSGDNRWAKVWLSIVGGDDDQIFKALKENIYDIQGDLNRQLKMKLVPRIQFYLDTSPRYAQHINEILDEIKKEDQSQTN